MKKIKKISGVLVLAMGLTLLSGCGKDSTQKMQTKMVDKYSSYCTLGDYKGIEYNAVSTEITDDMIQQQVDSLITNYTTTEYVTSGTVKDGDTVNIDFVGSVDGVEFQGGNTQGKGYDLTIGSKTLVDDFEQQLIGHKVGDKFDVNATFPDNYTPNPDLSGKDAIFAVTINSIKVTVVPEYTDAFIASYTDASTVDEYEQTIRDKMTEGYAENDASTNKATILNNIIDNAQITEYPTQDMEKLIDNTIEVTEGYAKNANLDLASYVSIYYGFSDENSYRDYVSEIVQSYMREKIVICAIAKAENIKATDEEIKTKKQTLMDNYGIKDEDKFAEYYSDEDVIYYTLSEKVTDFLLENATPASATDADTE